MPILLDPARAPALSSLLETADTHGIQWRLDPGAGDPRVAGVAPLGQAGPHELAFVANAGYAGQLADSEAGVVLLTEKVAEAFLAQQAPTRAVLVVCDQPYLLYARLAQVIERLMQPADEASVHPSAVVDPSATIEAGCRIGPLAVIEAGAVVGARTSVGPGAVIGQDCVVGPDSQIHARAVLYRQVRTGARAVILPGAVLGADGFGFAPDHSRAKGGWCKIPQFGGVRLGDDVEIGANTTVDRGALDDTWIGDGVKLDNQIMIGHNCRIGAHTAMAACTGIAGSTVIGERCTIGGAAMIGGHLKIGDDVFISAATAIFSNIDQPGRYTGIFPSTEHAEWERNAVAARRLARLQRRVKALEKSGQ